MGSSRTRNSTRVNRTRSAQESPKRRKSAKLRTAADALRDLKHTRRSRSPEEYRLTPTQEVREMRDGVPTTALRQIQGKLEIIRGCATVVARALQEQNCELDEDAALVLRHHVTDALTDQMIAIGLLAERGAS